MTEETRVAIRSYCLAYRAGYKAWRPDKLRGEQPPPYITDEMNHAWSIGWADAYYDAKISAS